MKKYNKLQISLLSICVCSTTVWGQSSRPNIVFIMADDLGFNDLKITGSDYYETPNIDKLASEGMMFRQAYAAAPNSAPSRACYMTGMYTPRHGVYTVATSERGSKTQRKLIPIPTKTDVSANFVTIAEALKEQGYRCGHVGKWHLGDDADGNGPLSQGFDVNIAGGHAGSPYSYFYPYCNKKRQSHIGLEKGTKGEYLTDRLTDEAILFIKESKNRPFFLHLAQYAVHVPLKAPKALIEKYEQKPKGQYHTNPTYAAMIENLDWNVGRLCTTIDSLGLSSNTLIIFCSDNGGSEPITNNYQLRGGKGTPYEGGTRIPLIMKWAGKIKAGTISDIPVIGIDFYPTLVTLANGIPDKRLDGKDIFSMTKKDATREIYWHFPAYLQANEWLKQTQKVNFRTTPYSAIRSGKWKLIYFYETQSIELYNLSIDEKEECELSSKKPTIAKKMKIMLESWLKKTHAPIPIKTNPDYISKNHSIKVK